MNNTESKMKKVIHKIASIDDQIIKAFENQKNGRKSIYVSIDTLKHLVVLRLIRLLIGWVVSAYILFIMLRDVNSLIKCNIIWDADVNIGLWLYIVVMRNDDCCISFIGEDVRGGFWASYVMNLTKWIRIVKVGSMIMMSLKRTPS